MFDMDKTAREYGVTAVENLFIRDYLPAAKGDYVKVYLWGLHQSQFPDENYGVREMAKELEMTLAQVESALRYWERRALVSRISENPEVYRFFSPMQRRHAGLLSDAADNEYTVFAESVYTAFGEKRKVTPAEIARMWEWVQDIGLPPEAVLMLISHCIGLMKSRFSFKQAEALAVMMKEEHVQTVEDAEAFLRHDLDIHKGVQDVLRQLGRKGRLASEPEIELYRKWRTQWQFDHDAIVAACAETAKGEPTFGYLDGILNGIRSRGESRTGADVSRQLLAEKDESALAREVTDALGLKISLSQTLNFYRQWRRHMPHNVVLCAATLCARTRDKAANMDDLLQKWQDLGLNDMEKVQPYVDRLQRINAALRQVFEALGYKSAITEEDRKLYEKWEALGFDSTIILEGAKQSHGAAGNKLRYLDAVLTAWHEAGMTDAAQIRSLKKPAAAPGQLAKKRTVSAQQYTQRQYTEEQLSHSAAALLKEAEEAHG